MRTKQNKKKGDFYSGGNGEKKAITIKYYKSLNIEDHYQLEKMDGQRIQTAETSLLGTGGERQLEKTPPSPVDRRRGGLKKSLLRCGAIKKSSQINLDQWGGTSK